MRLNVQQYRSDHALELYVAATPEPGRRLGDEADDVFSAVEVVVRLHGARGKSGAGGLRGEVGERGAER
jgi:hypothetical protein